MKYKLRMLRHINFKKLNEIITKISKENKKSKIYIFFDMILSYFIHGAGYYDYYLFDFCNLSSENGLCRTCHADLSDDGGRIFCTLPHVCPDYISILF